MNDENNSSDQFYKFNPMSSISAYELAQIIRDVFQVSINEGMFKIIPKEVKHHFQNITETEAKGK